MSWIRAFLELNKSLFLKGLLLLMAFLLGLQMGQSHLQRQWDAEKQAVQIARAKQEQHAVDVAKVQNQISKEISDDYLKKSQILAEHQFDDRNVGVYNDITFGDGRMSSITESSTRVNAASTNLIPVVAGDEVLMSCEQLVKDSAKTTLMLLEFQKWYERQASSATNNP